MSVGVLQSVCVLCVCVCIVCVCIVYVCVCVCVCVYVCGTACSDGVRYAASADFAMKWIDMKPHLPLQSVNEKRSDVKKALSRVKSHLVDRPRFAHLRTLPECWLPSAAVRGHLQYRSRWIEIWETEVETGHTDMDHERDGGAS